MLWVDKKYIGFLSAQLRNFKWLRGHTLANFSCPICGDSRKNRLKARAFLIPRDDSYFFYCHNGCQPLPLGKFIDALQPTLAKEYWFEYFKESDKVKSWLAVTETPKLAPEVRQTFLQSCAAIKDDSHPIHIYLSGRMIPHQTWHRFAWTDNFKQAVIELCPEMKDKYDGLPTDRRLIMPLYDQQKKLTGIQGRSLDPKEETLRYLTIKFDERAIKMFGLDLYDPTKPGFIFEGPIDSAFLPNALAMCGSDISEELLSLVIKDRHKTYVCMDNEPRSPETVNKMAKYIDLGFKVTFWSNIDTNLKDVNNMIMAGMTPKQIITCIVKSSHHGLAAKMALASWKKY